MSEQIDALINSFSESFLAAKDIKSSLETEKQQISKSQTEMIDMISEFKTFIEDAKTTIQTAKTEALELLEEIREVHSEEMKLKNSNTNSITILTKEINARFDAIEKKVGNKVNNPVDNSSSESKNDSSDSIEKYVPVQGSSYEITTRDGKEYVELSFSEIPPETVRNYLKDNYFGWSKVDRVWRANTKHLDAAKKITGED